ncbi:MAG: hypothetical protein IPM29_28290 [Planctomycetes bacterium]|nr:hypothetical protein [Planctomycetota bacterium]
MTGMFAWSLRDVLRRPGEALLVAAALAALALVLGVSLLLPGAVRATAARLLEAGPALVVRRVDAAGLAPLPESESLAVVRGVRGVLTARGRVFGSVGGPGGPVTVIGVDAAEAAGLGIDAPSRGDAWVGAGVADELAGALVLRGVDGRIVEPAPTPRRLPGTVAGTAAGFVLHRAVLVDRDVARELLGLPPDHVCDLALEVRHPEEAAAMVPDLTAALPFSVVVETRADAVGRVAATTARRGSLAALASLPAALALAVLIVAAARDRAGRRGEVALLKSLGWTTADVLRLHCARAAWIAVPALALGAACAWALVLWPGVRWPGIWFFGWTGSPPPLTLDPDGAALVLIEVVGLIGAPWLVAVLWPALRAATADPGELLAEDGPA